MRNPFKKAKAWMDWRGISSRDALYALFSVGFLATTIIVFAAAACQALST